VGTLGLVLLIPLAMVRSLVHEREARHRSVVAELGALWGQRQVLGAPMLTVPYRTWHEDQKGVRHGLVAQAHFLPDVLHLAVRVAPERRHRGLFEAVVYRLEARIEGELPRPDFAAWGIAAQDVLWDQATVSIGVSDPRGISEAPALELGGDDLELLPGSSPLALFPQGLAAEVPGLESAETGDPLPFATTLRLAGSGGVDFAPMARETAVAMSAPWGDPSFGGAFLPVAREIEAGAFDAEWQVSYFGTGVPAAWREGEAARLGIDERLRAALFGVDLLLPVDHYRKTERVVKYAVLFLALTFVAFFLFEVFRPVTVHPVQYLLVGSAQCLFYLLLLSLTEHLPFAAAYLVAAIAVVGLITVYARAVLRGGGRAAALGLLLATLYAYLFVLLQAEEYALLLGSLALFALLAAVMVLTRGVDWYGLARGRTAPTVATRAPETEPAG
jgi:inner membrane protein